MWLLCSTYIIMSRAAGRVQEGGKRYRTHYNRTKVLCLCIMSFWWPKQVKVVWRRHLSAVSCLAPRRPVLLLHLLSHSLWWIVLPPPPANCNEAEHGISANVCTSPCKPQHTAPPPTVLHCAAIPSISEDTVMQGCCGIVLSVCCMFVSHRALCPVSSPVIVPARNLGSMTVRTLGYLVDSVSRDLEQSIWCLPSQLHWIYTHSPSHTEAWSLSKSEQKLWYSIYTSSQ